MPQISIVLPTYNGEKYIRESIDSVIAQTVQDWEMIIVNDCSTDSTAEIINSYAKKDNRIRVINNEQNKRLPASLNIGFREAKGELYTWTSDDNMFDNNALEIMRDELLSDISCGMVVADADAIDSKGAYVRDWVTYSREKMSYNNAVGACFLYRKSVANSVGEYDCNAFLLEDYDYWVRVIKQCGDIKRIPQKLYKYRIHDDSLTAKRAWDIRCRLNCFRFEKLDNLLPLCQSNERIIVDLFYEMSEFRKLSKDDLVVFSKQSRLIPAYAEYRKDEPIAIYGAGKYGMQLSAIAKNVIFYVDKSDDKIGKSINGIAVISPKEYRNLQSACKLIVAVGKGIMLSVFQELYELGLHEFLLFFDVERAYGDRSVSCIDDKDILRL